MVVLPVPPFPLVIAIFIYEYTAVPEKPKLYENGLILMATGIISCLQVVLNKCFR